jgi:hypothetical protein
MGCNVLSTIYLSSQTKEYSRSSVSEFQAGAQAVIAAAKLDAKNTNKYHDVEKANTSSKAVEVSATIKTNACVAIAKADTASKVIAVVVAIKTDAGFSTAKANTASKAIVAGATIRTNTVVATAKDDTVSKEIVFGATVVTDAVVAITKVNNVSKALTVGAVKADPKDEDEVSVVGYRAKGCRKWIIFNPSAMPKKFIIGGDTLYACLCQGCKDIVDGLRLLSNTKLSVTFVTLSLILTQSVQICVLMTPTPGMNFVEHTSVANVVTQKSLSVTSFSVVVVDSKLAITVSIQWNT